MFGIFVTVFTICDMFGTIFGLMFTMFRAMFSILSTMFTMFTLFQEAVVEVRVEGEFARGLDGVAADGAHEDALPRLLLMSQDHV